MTTQVEIHMAHTQGFCAGVSAAIEIVDLGLLKYGTPLYVRHEIVHNTFVVDAYKKKGVIFIDKLCDVPNGHTVIFSAHGVAPEVYQEAKDRDLNFIDATCPLVTKVHMEAKKFSRRDVQTILIGHRGHQELIGTEGYVREDLRFIVEDETDVEELELDPHRPVGILTQTTLSITDTKKLIDKIKEKYPDIKLPGQQDICYATENRQNAVLDLCKTCNVIIICGSPTSSNSNRLCERAKEAGVESYIIDSPEEFKPEMIQNKTKIGLSSGASVPSYLMDEIIDKIKTIHPSATLHQDDSVEGDIWFPVPKELRDMKDKIKV